MGDDNGDGDDGKNNVGDNDKKKNKGKNNDRGELVRSKSDTITIFKKKSETNKLSSSPARGNRKSSGDNTNNKGGILVSTKGRSARWDRHNRLIEGHGHANKGGGDRGSSSGRVRSVSRDPPSVHDPQDGTRSRRRRSSSVNLVHTSRDSVERRRRQRRSSSSVDVRSSRGRSSYHDPAAATNDADADAAGNDNDADNEILHPSAAAMALLVGSSNGGGDKNKKKTSKRNVLAANNNDDNKSTTSSISSASAKQHRYPTSEHERNHPELEGVELPHIPTRRSSSSKPPTKVRVDRSKSRSRGVTAVTAATNKKDATTSSSHNHASPPSSRALVTTTSPTRRMLASSVERKQKHHNSDDAMPTAKRMSSKKLTSATTKSSYKRSSSTRSVPTHNNKTHVHDDDDCGTLPTTTDFNAKLRGPVLLSASTARMASSRSRSYHRTSSSRSVGRPSTTTTPRVWDVQGNEVAHDDDDTKKKQRSKSLSSPRPLKERSGDKSHSTAGTQPESLSSNEYQLFTKRRHSSHHDHNHNRVNATATTTPTSIEEEEEVGNTDNKNKSKQQLQSQQPEPLIIRKKRAKSKRQKEQQEEGEHADDNGTYHAKPMLNIGFSSAENSAASSISSTSTIESSYASTIDYGGRSSPHSKKKHDADNDDNKNNEIDMNVKDRALSAIHEAKGGAKQFATKGKKRLGELKGTSRKWQSALFM